MKVIAHRGASGYYPENTVLAFKKALEIGVDGLELDVHKSKDGELIVIHDEDIQRTFSGKGQVLDKTLKDLKKYKCRNFEFKNNIECTIPTLREVIELIKDENILINIEAKTDVIQYDLENDIIDLIEEYDIKDKILISSFNHKSIIKLKNIDDSINYGALYWSEEDYYPEDNIINYSKKIGVYSINVSNSLVNKEMVELAHRENMKVLVYTVNTPIEMRKMIAYNVDGVFTDYPELMKEILEEIN